MNFLKFSANGFISVDSFGQLRELGVLLHPFNTVGRLKWTCMFFRDRLSVFCSLNIFHLCSCNCLAYSYRYMSIGISCFRKWICSVVNFSVGEYPLLKCIILNWSPVWYRNISKLLSMSSKIPNQRHLCRFSIAVFSRNVQFDSRAFLRFISALSNFPETWGPRCIPANQPAIACKIVCYEWQTKPLGFHRDIISFWASEYFPLTSNHFCWFLRINQLYYWIRNASPLLQFSPRENIAKIAANREHEYLLLHHTKERDFPTLTLHLSDTRSKSGWGTFWHHTEEILWASGTCHG